MAETLISPGVLARENDQSFVTSQPVERGAAIVGPTVLGPVEKPTLISSFSSFQAIFGGALQSGSNEYTYLTSIAANNYFSQGGTSLLVTRVTSGSFDPALSTTIQNNVEAVSAGLAGNIISDYTSGGTGGTKGTFVVAATGVTPNNGATFSVVIGELTNLIAAQNVTAQSAVSGGTTIGTVTGPITIAADKITTSGGTTQVGTGATISITTDGGGTTGVLTAVSVVVAGSGYVTGNVLTVSAADLATAGFTACDRNFTFTVTDANLLNGATAINVTSDGAGYSSGDALTFAAANIGTPSADMIVTLTDSSIENKAAFVLETLSEGVIMNNTSPVGADTSGTELANGALSSGSADNLRWEIGAVNTASGVFSLFVRRGNDNNSQKVILESFNNISLDPFSPNYISRAIGDISSTLVTEGADTFLQESGSFPNISNYVRVKQVNYPTPNYFNNDGSAKNQFTGSLPAIGSGSFNGALGSNIPAGRQANFYQNINATDTQGLVGSDYNNAIALLANQDDYQFNVISVPGLSIQHQSAQITSVMNNAISRGDNIAVVDLVGYNQSINTVIAQAGGIDNSYTAAYWPWLQTVDPNSGQLVYIPASTFIPGVYAFTDASSDPWFAPAGITRGGMGQVVRAERKLTSTNRDTLYEANVNPIATFPSQGVVVFGQKTLQKAASALDRVNVRRLLITLKGQISQIADNLVFEQNTIATRQNFLTQVNPYLESVQQRQGLYAFKVVMDESNNTPDVIDRNELVGQIFLQPTRTAELILLDFNVLPTGATFPA